MKLWQKIIMVSTAVIAAAAVAGCGFLLVGSYREQEKAVTAMAQAEAAQSELQLSEERAAQSEQQAKELEQKLADAQKKSAELEEKLKKAEAENKDLKSKNESLKQQIDLLSANSKPQTVKPTPGKVCYLTFDDGPSDVTPQVLNVLKQYGVKATFFVTGSGDGAYLKRIANEGHAIGLHCNNHAYAKVYASETAYLNDLTAISKRVENATGIKSKVVRFPGGSSNTVSRSYSKGLMSKLVKLLPEMGYAYFDWNVDSFDAGGATSAAAIRNNVLNGAKGKNSICVLMHDGLGKQATAKALPGIIEGLKKQGYSFEVLTTAVTGFKHGVNN